MKCYQCEEPALLCEKPVNRLFCGENHHTLYHESWTDLLRHVNAQPMAKRLVLLGMKRAHDDDDPTVVTMRELEFLPDDVIMEVLLYTFQRVGRDVAQTKAAFKAREAAPRIKKMINEFIIGGATEISEDVFNRLTNESLSLFKGAKTLTMGRKPSRASDEIRVSRWEDSLEEPSRVTEEGLRQMTGLEKLTIRDYPQITGEWIKGLWNLKELILSDGSAKVGDDTLKALPQLTHIMLRNNVLITDIGIGYLSNLQSLDLHYCKNIRGTTFGSLPRLVKLELSGSAVSDDNLMSLGDRLEELTLDLVNRNITERGLSKMRRLKRLDTRYCSRVAFTSAALDACTESLEVVLLYLGEDLHREFFLRWDALSKCRNLKKVYLYKFSQLFATQTQAELEQERGIEFIFY